MVAIEQVAHGTLIFLACGCAARRGLAHPTGAATLVEIIQPCGKHSAEPTKVRAIPRGEVVRMWARHPVHPDPVRASE